MSHAVPVALIEHGAPTPTVTHAASVPVVEYVAPAPARTRATLDSGSDNVAPTPMVELVAPTHIVKCSKHRGQWPNALSCSYL